MQPYLGFRLLLGLALKVVRIAQRRWGVGLNGVGFDYEVAYFSVMFWFFWMVVPPAEASDCAGMTDCIDSILFETAELFHLAGGIYGYSDGVVDADIGCVPHEVVEERVDGA